MTALTLTDWLIIGFWLHYAIGNFERARASWQRWKILAAKLEIVDIDIESGRFN